QQNKSGFPRKAAMNRFVVPSRCAVTHATVVVQSLIVNKVAWSLNAEASLKSGGHLIKLP
ncbi:hypothetical protein, partial [Vibrio harveyi]|uniref:hypothetical protein n=1 Tax=Vibrio harveyi TaxID=669 RepID=UPI002ADF627C